MKDAETITVTSPLLFGEMLFRYLDPENSFTIVDCC